MITQRTTTSEQHAWASEQGGVRILRPTPLVTLLIHHGHLEAGFARHILQALEESLARAAGNPRIFVDGEQLHSYDPQIRLAATDWLSAHRDDIAELHALVRYRATRMAVSITNLLLGNLIVGHRERGTFDAALAGAIRRTRH